MKKISKILSSVLAASLALSCMAMNVMAASKAHTITITPDKTTGLKAGDTVAIELTVDNTEALVSFKYTLNYDATAFTADQTKVSRVEKCIDKTWLDDIKNSDGDWAYYLGNPTYNVKNAGVMSFTWAGAEGVEADYAVDNRVVGKFYLTVNEDVADGEYTFSITDAESMDAGEILPTSAICETVTVKVGEDKPAEPEVPTKATKYAKLVAGDGSYVVIDLINGETIKDTAKLFLPAGVKGGEANVGIKFMFTAGVAADGKVAPAVGDVFKLYHVKDSNADAKTEIATFDVE